MSRADDGLRALIRARLPPPCHVTSIETGAIRAGVPDAHVQLPGAGVWVECKAVRNGRAVALRPSQIAWLSRHLRCGGSALVAVRRRCAPPRGGLVDELHLLEAAEVLREGRAVLPPLAGPARGESTEALGRWHGGPARWDWHAVRVLLLAA